MPTTPLPAKPLAEVDRTIESYAQHNGRYLRNTAVGNILNLCGVSLPCGFTREGLPIGLMVYAKPFQEDVALRVARAYEHATELAPAPARPRLGRGRRWRAIGRTPVRDPGHAARDRGGCLVPNDRRP